MRGRGRSWTRAVLAVTTLIALATLGSITTAGASTPSLAAQLVGDPLVGGVVAPPTPPARTAPATTTTLPSSLPHPPTPSSSAPGSGDRFATADQFLSPSFQFSHVVPVSTATARWHRPGAPTAFVSVELGRYTFPATVPGTEAGAFVQAARDAVKQAYCGSETAGESLLPVAISSIPGGAALSCGALDGHKLSAVIFSAGNTVAVLSSTALGPAALERVADAQYALLPHSSDIGPTIGKGIGVLVVLAVVIAAWRRARLSHSLANSTIGTRFRLRGRHPKLVYLVTQIGKAAAVMFVVTFLTTMLAGLLPGGPLSRLYDHNLGIGGYYGYRLGYDDAIWVQYWHWLYHALHGNLGHSLQYPAATVDGFISNRSPVTIEIALLTLIVSLCLAIPLAMISAERPGGAIDGFITTISSLGASMPVYISGIFIVYFFAERNRWFPSEGWTPIGVNLGTNLRDATLPVATLVIGVFPVLLKVFRGDLVALSNEEFIVAARSRGLPEWYVLTRHMMRPAAASLVTVMGMALGTIISGSFLVEFFFTIPGLGLSVWNAVNNTDIALLQGVVVVMALAFVAINAIIDLTYRWLDPRVRVDG